MKRIMLILVMLLIASPAFATVDQEIDKFAARMETAHGFNKDEMKSLLMNTQPDDRVQQAFSKPLTDLPWRHFENVFVSQQRIENGVKFWNDNYDALKKAEQVYHVPVPIIVSILGIETNYGKTVGKFNVLTTLVTLGFYSSRRHEFFQKELEQFLLEARDQGWDVNTIVGSYEGAIGAPQFMPSSLRTFAVDFNEDGQIDLTNDNADAIGSVANYLNKNGWNHQKTSKKNIKVILRYNSNHNYANAVILLAKRIEDRRDAKFYELIGH